MDGGGGINGNTKCTACGSLQPSTKKGYVQAYDLERSKHEAIRNRFLGVILISGDCIFIGMQPILVYMSKVDGHFLFNPVSVNFLTEVFKTLLAICILLIQFHGSKSRAARSELSLGNIVKAARANYLLAIPAFLYSINNYLKFIMQLYFKPATVKMLGNLKILMIAILLRSVMKRKFNFMQWEALCLLLIGISVNQIPCGPNSPGLAPISSTAWLCTLLSVTIPSAASVFNEYALKSQFDTNVHLQNLFMFSYGIIFNFIFLISLQLFQGGELLHLFHGHSHATALLVANNAMQGILATFFFKYADAILKKYSSTIATIFTAVASAALFGHTLTINFVLGVSIVLISMHQFFSSAAPSSSGLAPKPSYFHTPASSSPFKSSSNDLESITLLHHPDDGISVLHEGGSSSSSNLGRRATADSAASQDVLLRHKPPPPAFQSSPSGGTSQLPRGSSLVDITAGAIEEAYHPSQGGGLSAPLLPK